MIFRLSKSGNRWQRRKGPGVNTEAEELQEQKDSAEYLQQIAWEKEREARAMADRVAGLAPEAVAEAVAPVLSEVAGFQSEEQPNPWLGLFEGAPHPMLVLQAQTAARGAKMAEEAGHRASVVVGAETLYAISMGLLSACSVPEAAQDEETRAKLAAVARGMVQSMTIADDPAVADLGEIGLAAWDCYAKGYRVSLDSGVLQPPGAARLVKEVRDVTAQERQLGVDLERRRLKHALRALGTELAHAADTIASHADAITDIAHPPNWGHESALVDFDPVGPDMGAVVRRALAAQSVAVPVDSPSNWFAPVPAVPFPGGGTPIADGVTRGLGETQAIPVVPEGPPVVVFERAGDGTPRRVTHVDGVPVLQEEEGPDHPAFATKLDGGSKFVKVVCEGCHRETWVPYANGDDLRAQYQAQVERHRLSFPECRP